MKENEIRKELLATELELLLRNMTDSFFNWKNQCGHRGWYDIPKKSVRSFFEDYVITSAKKAIEIYRQ
jgi:nitrite reductase/ring-hydroxylating ferredoxin subunit